MNAACSAHFVRAMAAQARVLGMQAENQHRLSCGNSVAYGVEEFNAEASVMEACADAIVRDMHAE